MNKPWLGYLGSAMIFIAGIILMIDKSYMLGALLIVVAIGGLGLKMYLNRKS